MPDRPDPFIAIIENPLDEAEILKKVKAPGMGALVVFHGVTRDNARGKKVRYLIYEAYAPMAVKQMEVIAEEIFERWKLTRIAMVHRIGRLEVGETSLIIAVAAAHRREAFESCRYAIDRLKKIVPIWKKEYYEDGEIWIQEEYLDGND